MKKGFYLFALFFALPLLGNSRSPSELKLTLQELRGRLSDLDRQCYAQKVELELLSEKILALEGKVQTKQSHLPFEQRLSAMEQTQKTLTEDLKTLKTYLNDRTSSLTSCEEKILELEKQLSNECSTLKGSLQSMISILEDEEGDVFTYTVKPGDSLGKIAVENKTNTRTIKKLNGLEGDTIYVGQKLKLPASR